MAQAQTIPLTRHAYADGSFKKMLIDGMTLDQMLRREPEGNWSYAYFSLIDPKASDPSYATITDHPYLYYVRMDNNHGPYQRVLFRQKVKLDWLMKAAAAELASHQAVPQKQ
jgi:hypothetical protein